MSDEPKKLEGKTIMWVEDDQFLSEIIGKKLRDQGASLEFTGNGSEVIEKLQNTHPDLLLLDILLPGKNGFEILEEMKKTEDLKDIPVILFSNLGQQEELDKGYELGADKFLVKAVADLDNVMDEIHTLIEKKEREGQQGE